MPLQQSAAQQQTVLHYIHCAMCELSYGSRLPGETTRSEQKRRMERNTYIPDHPHAHSHTKRQQVCATDVYVKLRNQKIPFFLMTCRLKPLQRMNSVAQRSKEHSRTTLGEHLLRPRRRLRTYDCFIAQKLCGPSNKDKSSSSIVAFKTSTCCALFFTIFGSSTYRTSPRISIPQITPCMCRLPRN